MGLVVSLYLAAFQLRLIHSVWDPFFEDGSERVLTSVLSRLLPIPDAALGALLYAADGVLAALVALGVAHRRALARALAGLGLAGAVTGIGLAILQPITAGTFCTLCLGSSLISVGLGAGALAEARFLSAPGGGGELHQEVT